MLLLGWGGGGGAITFMYLACKVMRRGCYVDVTLIILWQELSKLIVFGFTSKKVSQRH